MNIERAKEFTTIARCQNLSAAAKELNLSSATLALDLDDPDVRLRLMISFKILEMTGRIPHWETPHGENDTGNSGIVHQE